MLWWGVNLLLEIYVRQMRYGLVYGGVAGALGLMVWMAFSAMIVFFGAAWNAESAALHDSVVVQFEIHRTSFGTRPVRLAMHA